MNSKTTPKDFFMHLAATIVLYTAAIALINLSFSVINYYLPDALANYFYVGSVAWPISMLVVLIPLLYVLEWLIGKDISKMPEKKEIWIRRWRIYLTLFLAGATIIGDLITLINTYLNGEITSRFIYKVLVVLIVTGSIFKYYLIERMKIFKNKKLWQNIVAYFGIVVVIAAIVGGFMIVGSPTKQRALRFDQQRVNDLWSIQSQIINYWQTKGVLPGNLSDLNDSLGNFTVPKDPENSSSYQYTRTTPTAFQLCANFELASQDNSGRGSYNTSYPYPVGGDTNEQWSHGMGTSCFNRTIDPERYPVIQNPKIPKPI